MARSWSDGRNVLCVSDARTEREIGRYDPHSGRLVLDGLRGLDPDGAGDQDGVGDQHSDGQDRVREVVQALWDFLADPVAAADTAAGADADAHAADAADERHDAAPPAAAPAPLPVAETPPAAEIPSTAESPPAVEPAPAGDSTAGSRDRSDRVLDRGLGRLRRDGWAVLSPSGRQAAGADFDRLVIGPPGVFAITLRRGAEPPTAPRSGESEREGLHEGLCDAESAARALSAESGMAVKVTSLLAFVGRGADAVDAHALREDGAVPDDVLVARGEDIVEVLWALPAVYSLQERQRISAGARRLLDIGRHGRHSRRHTRRGRRWPSGAQSAVADYVG